jgi:uncharacterized protein (TIRG00374 family)
VTRRLLLMAAQAAVSVALLAWLVRGLDTQTLRHVLLTVPAWYYAVSLAVIIGGQVLYAWRWWLLLSAAGVALPAGVATRYYFIGVFANNFLPSTVGGDATKIYYLGRAHGYRTIVASVMVDRMLGLGSLAVIAAVASWFVPALSARFVALRLVVTLVALGSCAVIALVMFGTGGVQRWITPLGPWAVRIGEKVQRLRLDMALLLRQPRIIAYATALVLVYFLSLGLIYAWFMDVTGTPRPAFVAIFTAVSMTGVLSVVPISLNGLGVREQLHAWLFAPLGVPKEVAVAISLLLFGHVLVASAIGLVLWLLQPAASPLLPPSEGSVSTAAVRPPARERGA